MNNRSRTNGLPDERHQVLIVAIRNLPNPDSPETFGLKHFDSNDNERLCGVAFAPNRRNRGFSVCEDLVKNNFPKSGLLRDRPIIPAREVIVKDDLHGFEEIVGALLSGHVDTLQNVSCDL